MELEGRGGNAGYGPTSPAGSVTVERDVSPLPVGVYWVDLKDSVAPSFNMWARISPGVTILKTERFAPGVAVRVGVFQWFLFEVTEPTDFPAHFGFPNIAEKGKATDHDDTVQEPPPEPDPFDLPNIDDVKTGLKVGALLLGGALLLAGAAFISSRRPR